MYVVPYLMGPPGSPYSRVGVELTDSPYVVANMRLMTRMGNVALDELGESSEFVRGIHSLGDLSPERRFVCHFPEIANHLEHRLRLRRQRDLSQEVPRAAARERRGSRQGLDGRAHAGRSGSPIRAATSPTSPRPFRASAARPTSRCSSPSLPGYQIETVGDDICWMHVGPDGRLWAINPESGMFGAAPRHQRRRRTPTRCARSARRHLHQRRARARRQRRGGKGWATSRSTACSIGRGTSGARARRACVAPQRALHHRAQGSARARAPRSTIPRAFPSRPSSSAAGAWASRLW